MALEGVYDVESDYRLERGRGVERISPMGVVCGEGGGEGRIRGCWRRNSPTWLVRDNGNATGGGGNGGGDCLPK